MFVCACKTILSVMKNFFQYGNHLKKLSIRNNFFLDNYLICSIYSHNKYTFHLDEINTHILYIE